MKESILARAARLKANSIPFALVTVVRCGSPTSAKPGAKAVVEADGVIQGWVGGGCAQAIVIKTAKLSMTDGVPRLIRISPDGENIFEEGITDFTMDCFSGGSLELFIDPIIVPAKLLIIGASPTAQTLNELASQIGFSVQVMETFDTPIEDTQTLSFVVVATQGLHDESGLEMALACGAGYIAFIASERKAAKLRQSLKDQGFDEKRVAAIIAPAGIEIGAVTPEEIALSVLAGVVKAYRERSHVILPSSELSSSVTEQQIDPVCGMSADAKTAESSFEFNGNTYYFCCKACQQKFANAPEHYLG